MKKLLIVGCTSKIARRFIETAKNDCELYGTLNNAQNTPDGLHKTYTVNLANPDEVTQFTQTVSDTTFDGVLFFASAYTPDPEDQHALIDSVQRHLQVNALSALQIATGLHYNKGASVIFFGDSGLQAPKPNHVAYSLSKSLLENMTKTLAVQLKDSARVLCFRLGPVYARHDHPDPEAFHNRNLLRVDDAPGGLVRTLLSMLKEPDLGMTGSIIDYDGGAFLKRAR